MVLEDFTNAGCLQTFSPLVPLPGRPSSFPIWTKMLSSDLDSHEAAAWTCRPAATDRSHRRGLSRTAAPASDRGSVSNRLSAAAVSMSGSWAQLQRPSPRPPRLARGCINLLTVTTDSEIMIRHGIIEESKSDALNHDHQTRTGFKFLGSAPVPAERWRPQGGPTGPPARSSSGTGPDTRAGLTFAPRAGPGRRRHDPGQRDTGS